MSLLPQMRGAHPPAPVLSRNAARGRCGGAGRSIEPEARGARARHPRQLAAGRFLQSSEHLSDRRRNLDGGRLEIVGAPLQVRQECGSTTRNAARLRRRLGLAARTMKVREYILGRYRDARIDQHGREAWDAQRLRQDFADAAHHSRAGIDADRHVGANPGGGAQEARIGELEPVCAGEESQRRRGICRAAANPGSRRQMLRQRKAAELRARRSLPPARAPRAAPDCRQRHPPPAAFGPPTASEAAPPGTNASRSCTPANTTRLSSV